MSKPRTKGITPALRRAIDASSAKRINDAGKEKALELSRQGYGMKEIRRLIPGVTVRRVRRWRKEAGMPTRMATQKDAATRPGNRNKPKVYSSFKWAWEIEAQGHLIGDESTHWRNHPVAKARWRNILHQRAGRTNPNVRLKRRLRSRIYRVLKGTYKSAPTLKLTGCDLPTLRAWLEKQFKKGMGWHNHGAGWELDHKIPCAAFDLTQPSEQRKCFHYSNLQPLWRRDNRVKWDKIIPTQPELTLSLNA